MKCVWAQLAAAWGLRISTFRCLLIVLTHLLASSYGVGISGEAGVLHGYIWAQERGQCLPLCSVLFLCQECSKAYF